MTKINRNEEFEKWHEKTRREAYQYVRLESENAVVNPYMKQIRKEAWNAASELYEKEIERLEEENKNLLDEVKFLKHNEGII